LNFEERCYGKFFSPRDQAFTRFDYDNVEKIGVGKSTNYKGYMLFLLFRKRFHKKCFVKSLDLSLP